MPGSRVATAPQQQECCRAGQLVQDGGWWSQYWPFKSMFVVQGGPLRRIRAGGHKYGQVSKIVVTGGQTLQEGGCWSQFWPGQH